MSNKEFNNKGVYSLILTPFNEDRSINFETYKKYVEWQARQGADHLFACCGSSEMTTLSLDERIKLATLTAKHKGDTTIVATAKQTDEYSTIAKVEYNIRKDGEEN